jgi:gliding motility-associated-like protein
MNDFVLYPLARVFLLSLMISVSAGADAQLCNGSFGDPVVNITFGSAIINNNPVYAPPNTYVYTTSTCPNDGYYTITNSTSGCFGGSWHSVYSDHTGNGAFMLVNASYTPGDFFLTTVTDLCPNTTYEFAAWIMNVLVPNGIKPNLTFRIEKPDGTVLGQYLTGDIAETGQPQWQQYGLFFTTPANNANIVLRITNNAPGGNGNDLALDDITFRPCGPQITVSIAGNQNVIDICEASTDPYTLDATVSAAYQTPVYQWQLSIDSGATWVDIPGATTIPYQRQPTPPGKYWYRLAVSDASSMGIKSCRIASKNVAINVHPKPVVSAGPDRILITGDTITLRGNVAGENPTFSWSPPDYLSDPNLAQPVASPVTEITYTLFATSSFGCTNLDQATIKVVKAVFVPNAFTPNNDGKNDTWRIPYLDPEWDVAVSVYNRYGQLVYQMKGNGVSWDGTLKGVRQGTGTYVYILTIKPLGLLLKGTVTLIR